LTPAQVKSQKNYQKPPSVPLMTASYKAYLKMLKRNKLKYENASLPIPVAVKQHKKEQQ